MFSIGPEFIEIISRNTQGVIQPHLAIVVSLLIPTRLVKLAGKKDLSIAPIQLQII
jgi:hypothetical protein